MTQVLLNVAGRKIKATEITYDDLVILYRQFVNKYGVVPTYVLCDSKHNMPQGRIITRLLKENKITYNDFILQFGKTSHVRTESMDYDAFVKKFKDLSNTKGGYITSTELTNNNLGLPSASWFVKYCPDKTVKNYSDFISWCGFNAHRKFTEKEVGDSLIQLEKRLGRPILKDDITTNNVGFSMIVINRIYGSLVNARNKLGLMKPLGAIPLPFSYYKDILTESLLSFKNKTGKTYVRWKDLESGLYHQNNVEHKSIMKAFKRENIDLYKYINDLGFNMNPNAFSFKYIFDDGERVVSSMEYDFSNYLRSIGYVYNESYYRDVPYKLFTDCKGKSNCDYCLIVDNKYKLYIEIAGVISNDNNLWRTKTFKYKKHEKYRDKMLMKEKLLLDNNCNYIILFPEDMDSLKYKEILSSKIDEVIYNVA